MFSTAQPYPDLPDAPCYLNGEIGPLRDASISVMDRGFIFGDGIYEVVPVYGGRPFRFEQHMARLERSLLEVRIPNPHDLAGWRSLVERLIQAHAAHEGKSPTELDQFIYLQITRGVAPRDHVMLPGLTPTVFAMVQILKPVPPALRVAGVACVSADDFRWEKAHIKSTSLLGAVMSRQISADVGAIETVMFRQGHLSEAAASNVWVVRDGRLMGPPKDHLVLEGIRFGLMQELCHRLEIPFELRRISRAEVLVADELLLSSATKEVLAITTLDGRPVGNGPLAGKPGPVYARLYEAYQVAKRAS
jgi:D-alanine transaminase